MSRLTSTLNAILLIVSLIFILIFIYLFVSNANLIIPGLNHDKDRSLSVPVKNNNHDHHQHDHDNGRRSTIRPKIINRRPNVDEDAKNDNQDIDNHQNLEPNQIIVATKHGKVIGFNQQVFDKNISTFLGVPFGVPPINDKRFKRTIPITKSWTDAMDCTQLKPKCPQIELDKISFTDNSPGMSEDCLYLNIWTPTDGKQKMASGVSTDANDDNDDDDNDDKKQTLKPVMIWIYGGGFFMGTANYDETDGRVLASVGDVVVVTFEYRVGPFGFIDLGTDNESGNQGAFDQIMAMTWVKDNIESFGGDADSMTIFGESSGAISIGLHILSKESSPLIRRAIFQSGSPMMTNAFFARADKSIPDFVKALQCIDSDADADEDANNYDVQCLRRASVNEILNVTKDMHSKYFFAFPPNVDDLFLSSVPTQLIKSGDKNDIFKNINDVLIGNNLNSFSYMLWLANRDIFAKDGVKIRINSVDDVKMVMKDKIGHLLQMPTFQISFLTSKLFKNLTDANQTITDANQTPRNSYLDKLIDVLGDVSFVCPSKIIADELASIDKNVYSYLFSHQITRSKDKWSDWFGVTLHDEIPLIFGHPLRHPLKYSGKDIEMSKRMIETWSNFARTGKMMDQKGVVWPKYEVNNRVYVELNSDVVSIGSNFHEETCETFKLGFDLLN